MGRRRQGAADGPGHAGPVRLAAFAPDGRQAVTASAEGRLRVGGAGTGRELRQASGGPRGIQAWALSPDGRLAATFRAYEPVRVWDVDADREVRRLEVPDRGGGTPSPVAFSPDGAAVAIADGAARPCNASGREEPSAL